MIRYSLDQLGWYQFEWLCQSILKSKLGLAVESWGGRSDWGRDAYCSNPINFTSGIPTIGPHIFQCKFIENANASGAKIAAPILKSVRTEIKNIKERESNGKIEEINSFILLTNAKLDAKLRAKITKIVADDLNCDFVLTLDGQDICAFLDEMPRIRHSFPQLLSLRDLDVVIGNAITKGSREKSNVSLKRAAELMPFFVPTDAHLKALECLINYYFVVLAGPPEMGKTTIASVIGLQKAAEDWDFIDLTTPQEFFLRIEKERSQIFFVDDVFGSTEYDPSSAHMWSSNLDSIIRSLDNSHWFVWTSRSTPLKLALEDLHLQGKAEKFPAPAQVIVDTRELLVEEKALMLFRHAKNASLEEDGKDAIRKTAIPIVNSKHLTPERIRRLVNTWLPEIIKLGQEQSLEVVKQFILKEIEKPTDRMQKSFRALLPDLQCFLFSILDLEWSQCTIQNISKKAKELFDEDLSVEPQSLLPTLTDHFLYVYTSTDTEEKKELVSWIHPSWRDLVIEELGQNRKFRKKFLSRCSYLGFIIALSIGGGATGQRDLPLLLDMEDLDLSISQISELIKNDNWWQIFRILNSLIKCLESQATKEHELVSTISEKCKILCLAFVERSKTNTNPFNAQTIETYYKLQTLCHAPIAHPAIQKIWKSSWKPIISRYRDDELWYGVESFSYEWRSLLELITVLKTYRSHLFEHERLEKKYLKYASQFLNDVENYLENFEEVADESKYKCATDALNSLSQTVEQLFLAFPSLKSQCILVNQKLLERKTALRDKYFDIHYRTYSNPEQRKLPKLDIEKLFSAL